MLAAGVVSAATAAADLARHAFSEALHGSELPAKYLGTICNATKTIETLQPAGCQWPVQLGADYSSESSPECVAWRRAAEDVAKASRFFASFRALGRQELTCEGNTELTDWELANLTGAMMQPQANAAALEVTFREVAQALRTCAGGNSIHTAERRVGPFFPTSGTLISLLRYGALVGNLTDGRSDFVDNDLDFFVLVPGSRPSLWSEVFVPCMLRSLGVDLRDWSGVQTGNLQSKAIAHDAVWQCSDMTHARPMVREGMPKVSSEVEQWISMDSDYLQCQRKPMGHIDADDMEQTVVVDLVRVLTLPGGAVPNQDTGVAVGGWDRAEEIPLQLLLPSSTCRMLDQTVPCPRDPVRLLQRRSNFHSTGRGGCLALPEITADRCSYHPDNVRLLRTGLGDRDLAILNRTASELKSQGHASFFDDFGPGACVEQRWRTRRGRRLSVDARVRSSYRVGNRLSTIGAEPLRLYLWRFRMLARTVAGRMLKHPMKDFATVLQQKALPEAQSGWREDNAFFVSTTLHERLGPLLRRTVGSILDLGGGTEPGWHLQEFSSARPLEFCAAVLMGQLLEDPAALALPAVSQRTVNEGGGDSGAGSSAGGNSSTAFVCNFREGPCISALSRGEWLRTLEVLQGAVLQVPKRVALSALTSEALVDASRESWATTFGVHDGWRKGALIGELRGMRVRCYQLSVLCRWFVAQWALQGEPGKTIDMLGAWEKEKALFKISFKLLRGPIEHMKNLADTIGKFGKTMTPAAFQQGDVLHWPQAFCASILLRTFFRGCSVGPPDADAEWRNTIGCRSFGRGGQGPWRLTGLLLRRLVAWKCALRVSRAVSADAATDRQGHAESPSDFQQVSSSEPLKQRLLGCLSRTAAEEVVSQASWESVQLPLPGLLPARAAASATALLAEGGEVASDAICLRTAARLVATRLGGREPGNPAARVPAHKRCRSEADMLRILAVQSPPVRAAVERLHKHLTHLSSSLEAFIPPFDVQCPQEMPTEALNYNLKYLDRAKHGLCQLPQGMWQNFSLSGPSIRCKYNAIARLFGFAPGARVLHLGAACGHHSHLLSLEYGVRVVGIELLRENVDWAKERFAGEVEVFCAADAVLASDRGGFLPNGTFDAVVGNAVFVELPAQSQCRVAQASLRLLAPGGCAWFGYLGESKVEVRGEMWINLFSTSFWSRCFASGYVKRSTTAGAFVFTAISDEAFFGTVEYSDSIGKNTHSLFVCKDADH